jgi:protein-disulfide isomerase
VHFASFSSARSVRGFHYLRRLYDDFPNSLRWAHRNVPSERDELGLAAAQLAVRAQAAGRFWELHDRLYALDGRLSGADLERIASESGLEPVVPGQTADLGAVKRDIDAALRAGIGDESAIFVNGRYFNATFPYEQLHALVAEELAGASAR